MLRIYFIFYLIFAASIVSAQQKNLSEVESLLLDARYEEVIQLVDETIEKSSTPFLLNIKKAEALIRMGRFEDADALLKKIEKESIANDYYQSLASSNYGAMYLGQGKFDPAITELQKAINGFDKTKKSNTLEAADAISCLGNVYRSTGKYTQAEEQLQMALSIRLNQLTETHELVAASYNDLGLVYSQVDGDKAFEYYEKALAAYQKLHTEEHPKIAIANTNLGVLNLSEKLYGDAVNYFESALKIWEKIYSQPHPNNALVLMNLGQTYSGMGNQKAALEFYEKARTMYEASQGKKHPDVAYVYNLLGNQKIVQNKYDEALADYQKAVIANVPDFNTENIQTNPATKNFYNGTQLLYSLMYKAQALELKYLGKTLKDSELILGIRTLQVADSLIDRLRQQATNESDKITLGAIANEVYADGVRITHMLSEVALKNRNFFREQSFYFAEKSKSAVLLEAISDTNAKSFANIPDEVLEEEKNIKATIALTSQKLAEKPSENEEKRLRGVLFNANRNYENFTNRLEKQYPEYFNLKFNSSAPSIEQLQKLISEKTAILSYFIDEKNKKLYVFIISKGKFRIVERELPKEYDRYLTGLRNSLFFQDIYAYTTASRNLYKLLIPTSFASGIPSSVQDLVIVPTGRMSVLPFETLLTKEAKTSSRYNELPYLLKKYSIRYEFSACLVLQKQQQSSAGISSVMLCAPVKFPSKDNLIDLPGTETEVNAIAQLFKNKNIRSQIYLQSQASETAIKAGTLTDYSVLHFATHGIVDENNPELSRIFLQNTSDKEDGNLFAGEIYNLKLNANLVALSACQTGLGKISEGEGVLGV
jgi:CHAT domain-containing protein/uncharacterized protein HemY